MVVGILLILIPSSNFYTVRRKYGYCGSSVVVLNKEVVIYYHKYNLIFIIILSFSLQIAFGIIFIKQFVLLLQLVYSCFCYS